MEQKQISSCDSIHDRLPPFSAKYPWLVSQRLEALAEEEDHNIGAQVFYTIHYPLSNYYRCRIPELLGRRIRGCFHGWVILSSYPDQVMWSLWNPLTCKTILLPPLRILKDATGDSVSCCLSSPPHDPCSLLLLAKINKSNIIFCRLDRKKRKRLRWTEMTYAKQLKSITGIDNDSLHCLTFCNGKLYALSSAGAYGRLVQVDIVFKDREVVISLMPLGKLPCPSCKTCDSMRSFLKGSCTELFYIELGFDSVAKKTIGAVYLFKLEMTSMIWEEMEDVKDTVFFVNLADHYCSVDCRRAVASELGGYIHILGKTGKVIYSCGIKDKTVSQSRLPCLVSTVHVSLWECRLQEDDHDEEIKCIANSKQEDNKEEEMVVRSGLGNDDGNSTAKNEEKNLLVNIPFDVLKKIMKYCIGVEYLHLRATCKDCRLAAPVIGWRNITHEERRRLHTYSLVSPWLVVFDKYKGIITFTDPMFGDKYFIKTPPELIGEYQVFCSRYGWLLLLNKYGTLEPFFFNPFTKDVLKLPPVPAVDSLCFSEPPTSPDCMVVGFAASLHWHVYVLVVNQPWLMIRMVDVGSAPKFFKCPTFYGGGGQDIYALNGGELNVFRKSVTEERSFYYWDHFVVEEAPRGCSSQPPLYYLVKCDQHLLLVVVDEFGESIEVFKRQNDWEKIDSLGRHMIFICGSMCMCIEAKTPEMENKIYFPLHKSGKIVFYSLETCLYHTFNGRIIDQGFRDFFGAKYHVYPHAWIEPSWS